MGFKIWDVPIYSGKTYGTTLYTRTIDISADICVYVSYALLAIGFAIVAIRKIREIMARKAAKKANS
jgi:hypothetical protein